MSATTELVPLAEDQAREAINRWSQGFFRIRYLGDKIFLNKIIPCYSYNVRLQTEYEERTVATASEPYHGQPIDNHGTPPEPWNIPVRQPEEFEVLTETLRVPHTERVTRCPQCAGVGEIACPRCHGTGHTACSWCGGSGFIQRMEPRPGQDAQGQTTVRFETVRFSCPSCSNGRVSCSSCGGNGRVTCPQCEGHCRVCLYERLTVRFRNKCLHEVLDTTEVPDENFEKLKGEAIFTRHAPRVETVAGLPPTVERAARNCCANPKPSTDAKPACCSKTWRSNASRFTRCNTCMPASTAACGSTATAISTLQVPRGAATAWSPSSRPPAQFSLPSSPRFFCCAGSRTSSYRPRFCVSRRRTADPANAAHRLLSASGTRPI